MVCALLPELHAEILCFLSNHKQTLKQCSLVSRDLRHLSQALLFESYTIYLTSEWPQGFRSTRILEQGLVTSVLTNVVQNVPSLCRLRLIAKSKFPSQDLPVLSAELFQNLLPLARDHVFDLHWEGAPKSAQEVKRLGTLLGAARRVDFLYISYAPVAELLATVAPLISPTLLHFSTNSTEDVRTLSSRLDLSNCRSLSLSVGWSLPDMSAFYADCTNWLPPSVFRSLEALKNLSLSFLLCSRGIELSIHTGGLYWMSEVIPQLRNLTTFKSIRVDTGLLPGALGDSNQHVELDVMQALLELGDAFRLLSGCAINNDIRACLTGSPGSNNIQIHFRMSLYPCCWPDILKFAT
ncbi:hypothetical protein DL96DRAFT_1606964 [Flagelloscypha sp. PMI_526]|nr:hypothetical protein DL96DRAFT_1606964 [Flagelloscypha sp. PMI_526]